MENLNREKEIRMENREKMHSVLLNILKEDYWTVTALSSTILTMSGGGVHGDKKAAVFRAILNLVEAARDKVKQGSVSLPYDDRAAALGYFEDLRSKILLKHLSLKAEDSATEATVGAAIVSLAAPDKENAEKMVEEVTPEIGADPVK